MWRCPDCRRQFANRNQSHACGRYTLASHFAGKPKIVPAIFEKLLAVAKKNGPVHVLLPEKTRIAFRGSDEFCGIRCSEELVDGHVVLSRRLESPKFRRIETFSPRNHRHAFRFERVDEIDNEVAAWFAEAYRVGEQRHLL
jgi:hypothetical protein